MRIVAGIARSIVLSTPAGQAVRPTIGRAREALFSSLGDFGGLRVVDLFAGSGALGLEAASRGAAEVAFIERDRRHAAVIEENVEKVQRAGAGFLDQVIVGDVLTGAFRRVRFEPDLVIADPPYAESAVYFHKLAQALVEWAPGAKIVWELPDYPGAAGDFLRHKLEGWELRRFGGTDFFIRK